jgi:16S rRNA (adenine1518-N6/adenine1519-N6)-dimethyltransferase
MSHQPRKRFGQHFLHDPAVIQRIIDAIAPGDGIAIVEIGPGRGALTVALLQRAGKLDVVEIDRDLAALLAQQCRGLGELHIHIGDALQFDYRRLHRGPIKIVGNLPYNISTPLLFHLLARIDCIHEMIFMMQKEIVDRICAQPHTSNYGRLSVMVQSRCRTEKLMNIGPGAFTPAPRVNSSVIRLTPAGASLSLITDARLFADVVLHAFNQRRKTLRNSLKDFLTSADFERLGLAPTSRAETLSVRDYINISNYLAAANSVVDNPVD